MASGKSLYWKNQLINAEFRGAAITFPDSLWLRLYTTVLDEDVSGTEVTADSYAPVEFPCDNTNFGLAVAGRTANLLQKPVATAAEDWGILRGWAAWDAESGGNAHYWGDLDDVEILTGAVVVVPIGALNYTDVDEA